MSNIPSNAMPHAGGTSTNTDDRTATQPTASRNEQSSVSYGSQYSRQPDQYRQERYQESDYRQQSSGSLMEKARDHKSGIALGVAVGAIAAAAIPFMFAGKKKQRDTRETDYSADLYIDKRKDYGSGRSSADFTAGSRTTATAGTGGTDEFSTTAGRTESTRNY